MHTLMPFMVLEWDLSIWMISDVVEQRLDLWTVEMVD